MGMWGIYSFDINKAAIHLLEYSRRIGLLGLPMCHSLGSFNNKILFFHNSGGCKAQDQIVSQRFSIFPRPVLCLSPSFWWLIGNLWDLKTYQ